MAYSLLDGGKRIRGCLTLAMCELCGGEVQSALPLACAIEMVHAYSLIHDDLPCMDNDDLRRGKPSCHIKFGEGTALLAGDALLTHAFSAASDAYFNGTLPAETVLRCVNQLSRAAGVEGMIGGQAIDTAPEEVPMTPEQLEAMHSMKTGALIRSAAVLGCLAAGAPVMSSCRPTCMQPKSGWRSKLSMIYWMRPRKAKSWGNPPAMPIIIKPPTSPCTVWKKPEKWYAGWFWKRIWR